MKHNQHDAYPGLDTLRAVGAIAVLATHTSFWTGQYNKGFLGAASSRLDIGVAFFFVLSGFLLGRPYVLAMSTGRPLPSTGRYLWKRALRILPLYWLIAITALIVLSGNNGAGIGTWLQTLTLSNLYVSATFPAGLTQMWSLSTEVAFYLVLPTLMWCLAKLACRNGWNPRVAIATLAALVAINIAWLLYIAPHRIGAGQWLPAYLSWFAIGLFFAIVVAERKRSSSPRLVGMLEEVARHPGTCWLMAAALFAISTTPLAGPTLLIPPTHGEAVTKNLVYAVIAGLIVLPSILGSRSGSRYAQVLGSRLARRIGLISYSIFAVHLLIIHGVADYFGYPLFQGNGWELFLLTLAISLVVSELLYRLVEEPLMRLRNITIGRSKVATAHTESDATNTS